MVMKLAPKKWIGAAGLGLVAFTSPWAQAQASPQAVTAQTPLAQTSEDAELIGLLKILKEETAVATKTRMNGDYVPGIVTVLRGDEMAAIGARTVWDALSMVPGIEAVRDAQGLPSVVVRGIQFPFNSGNVKVLIDSLGAARDNAGINSMALDLPIQLVDRIEVIRGPGSVVYGDFAYMGLIHVITKKAGRGLYARAEAGGAVSGGLFGGGRTKGGLEYALSASALTGGSADVPRRRDVEDTRGFVFGSLKYQGFSLSSSLMTRQVKDASIEPINGQQTHSVIDARYEKDLSKSAHLEVRADARTNRYRNASADLDGNLLEGGVGLRWSGVARQSWLFDASVTRSTISDALFRPPVAATTATPTPPPPGAQPPPPPPQPSALPRSFGIHNETLGFISMMAQDTIEASARIDLTLGARFDRYADIDTRITPRASLVFRVSDRNILKLQYAEGFRAPTFFELYSQGFRETRLNFEVNQTSEINVVHRRPDTVVRVTAYYQNLKDLLYVVNVDANRNTLFGNARKARVMGAEFEVEHELGKRLKASANLTWLTTKDSRNSDALFIKRDTVPSIMGNLALIAAPSAKTRLIARWHFVGDRGASALPAYHEFEIAATQKGVGTRGLDLRAGARFSRGLGVVYPHVLPTGTQAVSYEFPKLFAEVVWSR